MKIIISDKQNKYHIMGVRRGGLEGPLAPPPCRPPFVCQKYYVF